MADDNERIARKAHELWEAEGRPHGRDQSHWDQAKEIIALEDSEASTLLPADSNREDPVEEKSVAIDNEGQVPGLTDTGEHDLTSIDREPAATAPKPAPKAVAKSARLGDASKSEKAPARAPSRPRTSRKKAI
jgi:hypothetical protein